MNSIKSYLLTLFCILGFVATSSSQVLISLLLGDKLNSDKLEFGLAGGLNWSNMTELEKSKLMMDWHLGFYFNFKMNEHLFINTGVIVKSKMGAGNLDPYSVSQYVTTADSAFITAAFADGGKVDRKLNYFNEPITLRYRFANYIEVEGGMMFGLRYKSFDLFKKTVNEKDDLTFKYYNSDNYTRLDAGFLAGAGVKLKKGQGLNIFGRYYYGLVDVDKMLAGSQKNSSIYAGVEIPIGKGKAEKKKAEKEQEQQNK